jgi:L-lactate dehydrogenase complex protein LldG
MVSKKRIDQFSTAARSIGAEVFAAKGLGEAASYVAERVSGPVLVPSFSTGSRFKLKSVLSKAGVAVESKLSRESAAKAQAGITGVNFAMADTGTLALESTDEAIRLATTLPELQFALLDPEKILADSLEAVAPLRQLHQRDPRNYIAYITGPSRTADIERVLTIGVHGPKQLHILLVPGLSKDLMEM